MTRRTQFDLKKAQDRAHILEGALIALDHIEEVIKIIRSSKAEQEAKENLMNRFSLSDRQAQYIVDMRLGRLTGMEPVSYTHLDVYKRQFPLRTRVSTLNRKNAI